MRLLIAILALSVGSLNASDTDLLLRAIIQGDLKTMETLLSAGLDPNLPNSRGQTPLNFAIVVVNQKTAANLLLTWHADPNKPLDNAAKNGQLAETPLLYAARRGDAELISILLAHGARIDTRGPGGLTALHLAVVDHRLAAMQLLLDKAADPNLRDAEGASPLDDAVWGGTPEAVAMLLSHGAHLNDPDTQTGATPINEAAFKGNTRVVQFLLQFHPDLGIADNRGYSPLDSAVRMGKEDSAMLLLNAEPKDRLTAQFLEKIMTEAVSKNQARVAAALLGQGVSVNSMLASGSTPLGAAAFAGAAEVVSVLLAGSADPNLSDSDGASPLWSASLKGYDAVAETLLDYGAAVNHLNTSSQTTALYAAASLGQEKVVKLLLDRGADSSICGNNHKSPYQAALENGYRDVAIQLQNRGGATGCKQ